MTTAEQAEWLDCAICGAADAFQIDPNDGSVGYCRVEDKHWKVESIEPLAPDRGDVELLPLEPKLCDCGQLVTHCVRLFLRNIGREIEVDRGCEKCCAEMFRRLRVSLPPEEKETE